MAPFARNTKERHERRHHPHRGARQAFGHFRALDGLDLDGEPGEVHGFLGPNGAGKSTTIRIILGLMKATGGRADSSAATRGTTPHVCTTGWRTCPVTSRLWSGLTGGQCLDVLAETHGGVDEKRRAELIERFDLDPTKRVRDYSKGNRQKVALIAALATEADLLVLDEPTSGLDPLMEQAFQGVIRERRAQG